MKNNKGIKLKEMDKLFQLQIQLDYSSHLCSQVHVSCLAFTLYCFFFSFFFCSLREQKKNHFFAACPKRPSREKKEKKKAQLTT